MTYKQEYYKIKTLRLKKYKKVVIKMEDTLKASSHIDDTTRQQATRPVLSLPIQSNGSSHTYAARPRLVVTTKSCCHKNRSGSDFCHVSQRQYQENC